MKDNSNRKGINAGKSCYDGLSVRIVEMYPSGVLCGSSNPIGPEMGLSQQTYIDGGKY